MPCCFPKLQREPIDKDSDPVIDVKPTATPSDHVILFLGTGESGKTTFYRQLKILYGGGYTADEMAEFGQVMQSIVILDANRLAQAISNPSVHQAIGQELVFTKPAEEAIYVISQWAVSAPRRLTTEIADTIAAFWADPTVKKVFDHRALYHLSNQANYFFDRVQAMAEPSWTPIQADLINFRVRTTGVIDQRIHLHGTSFRVVDVGGQRSERRKWIKHFTGVSIVVYMVAISEYDQMSWEDSSVNRMEDSLKVFADICATPELAETAILLFFNKIDLFRAKIETCPLNQYHSDYQGDGSPESCLAFLVEKFMAAAKPGFASLGRPNRCLRHYFTTAIDPESVKEAFADVNCLLMGQELKPRDAPIMFLESDATKRPSPGS